VPRIRVVRWFENCWALGESGEKCCPEKLLKNGGGKIESEERYIVI
jgi:hypothetical protein